jgi:hypothetical protein
MSDQQWDFWLKALAGEAPRSLVRGIPEAGFFLLRERRTHRTPEEDRTIGGPRHKVTTIYHPVAIWEDEFGWHCVVNYPRTVSYLIGPAEIDETIFSRCSRAPITHDDYLEKVQELESARERDRNDQAVEHDDIDHPA